MIQFNYFSLILLVLAMFGCSESLIEPEVPAKEREKSQFTEKELADQKSFITTSRFTGRDSLQGVTFKAKVSGTFSNVQEGVCQDMKLEGYGKAAHFGHVRVVRSHCIIETGIANGEFLYTGAKGDEIYGTYEGRRSPMDSNGSFTFELEEKITGGTGRFAEVTGSLTTTGTFYPNEGFSYVSDGWMLNTNSNKQSK